MGLIPHSELDAFVQKYFGISNAESMSIQNLNRLYNWLEEISLPHKFLRYIPEEVAKKDKFLYVKYLHVMMDSGKLEKALKQLDMSYNIFTKAERHLLKSVGLYKDGSKKYSKSNYELALMHAREKDLPMIDHEFHNIEHTPELIKYLNKCLLSPESEKIARSLLVRIYYEQKQEEELRENISQMKIKDYLGSKTHLSNMIHMKILYKMDLKECLETMEMLVSDQPDNPRILLILGLAYYMNNEHQKALIVIEESQIDYLYRSPSNQIIAAVILDANKRVKDSRYFLKGLIPSSRILPEYKLIDGLTPGNIYTNTPEYLDLIQN
jgi:tetratricopeptide (TPR) repeat protein